ncbi:MAG: cytochrome c biogenesis protein CcsA [Acidobacteria bacterium]|nr:cytochrome c biogenesis protein CcsA [Acidobacteriota bacterium]
MIELLRITLLLYFLSVLVALGNLFLRRAKVARIPPFLAFLGFLFHLASLAAGGWIEGEIPIQSLDQTLSFLCWGAVLVYVVSYYRYRMESLNLIVPFLVLLLMVISNLLPHGTLAVQPGLRNPLDQFHIVVAILGVSMLFITFATSLLYLVLDRGLKAKRPLAFRLGFPALEKCERVGHHSLVAGFSLLTLGLITGAVAAAGGGDAFPWRREGLAILSWVILAVILLARLARGWRGRKAAILTIVAFTGILVRMLRIF